MTLKIIYSSFVRSKLEYASVIWCPYNKVHVTRAEKVQKKFIKFVISSVRIVNPFNKYDSKCSWLGLNSLEFRRKMQSAMFVFDIINGYIDCRDLLSLVPFCIPPRSLRYTDIFNIPRHHTNYSVNSTLTRTFIYLNDININQQKGSNSQI